MASTPINTAATGAVTGAVVTIIAAVVKHFNIDLPADAQVSVAVGIVAAAHWLGDKLAARGAAKGRLISTQTFTASGSYTPTPGTTTVSVTGAQGGAGGGSVAQ